MASASGFSVPSKMMGGGIKTVVGSMDHLPQEMHDMKLQKAAKVMDTALIDMNSSEPEYIITTTIGGRNNQPKQIISYAPERIVGTGSFGIVFQAKCVETWETVAIKKVVQDKRYKNREMQIMLHLDHPNVVGLKHCFYSTKGQDEVYLNLVLEYVPETIYRIGKHYTNLSQRMPLTFVKLYIYQVFQKRLPSEAVDLVSRLLQYSPDLRCTALEACIHQFFDELRDPNTKLPSGRPLPPLFNFKPQASISFDEAAILASKYDELSPLESLHSFVFCWWRQFYNDLDLRHVY